MPTLSQKLTSEQLALLPTEADIAFYEEHGWFITPKVIPDEVIDLAIAGSQKFYRGEREREMPYETGYSDWKPGDGDAIRNNQHVSYRQPELRQLMMQPIIGAIASRLARSQGVRLFEDTLVYKAPTRVYKAPTSNQDEGYVGWHTDYSYSSNCTSSKMLSAWIPFHDITIERSPLVAIDKSHKWHGNEHLRYFNLQNLEDIEQKFTIPPGEAIKEVPILLKKGQISFHHSHIIHGSYPNRSYQVRQAFALYLQDYDNCYRHYWNNGTQIHHFLDSMCRRLPNGKPDYSDSEIFPTIWLED